MDHNFNSNQYGNQPYQQNTYGQQPSQNQYGQQQYSQDQYNQQYGQQYAQNQYSQQSNQQYGQQQYSQNQYAGQQYDQQYSNLQYQQSQDQYSQQYAQQGSQYSQQSNQYSQQGSQYDQYGSEYGSQYNQQYSQARQEPKKVKSGGPRVNKGLIMGLIAGVLVIAIAVVAGYFFLKMKRNKEDIEAAENNVKGFITAYQNQDTSGMKSYFPNKLLKDEEVEEFLTIDNYAGFSYYDYSIKDIVVSEAREYDVDAVTKEISDNFGSKLYIDKTFLVGVSYTECYRQDGADVENPVTCDMACIKVDDSWYVADSKFITSKLEMMNEFAKNANDEYSQDVVKNYLNAYGDKSIDRIRDCFPDEVNNLDTTTQALYNLEENFGYVDEYGYSLSISDISITKTEDYDASKAKEDISSEYGLDIEFEDARKITADCSATLEYGGIESDESMNAEFICGKIYGKWYIINNDFLTAHNEIIAHVSDEADQDSIKTVIENYFGYVCVRDFEGIVSCYPPAVSEMLDSTEAEYTEEDNAIKALGLTAEIDDISYDNFEEYDETEAEVYALTNLYTFLVVDKAYKVDVSYNIYVVFQGERGDPSPSSAVFYMVKVDGEWYMIGDDEAD